MLCTYFYVTILLLPRTLLGVTLCRSNCMSLQHCGHYTDLLKTLEKPLKWSVVRFLRVQQCGFANGFPHVCCAPIPKNLNVFTNPERMGNQSEKIAVNERQHNKGTHLSNSNVYNASVDSGKAETLCRNISNVPAVNEKKAKTLNEFFRNEYVDFVESFDFFRRRRGVLDNIDIEIR